MTEEKLKEQIEEKKAQYEERLVAYIDILGWKGATETEDLNLLLEAVGILHVEAESHNEQYRQELLKKEALGRFKVNKMFLEIQVSVFSDHIIISKPVSFGGRILSIHSLCAKLLAAGFLTRGAITIGKLYHKDNIVFGPALNHAVDIEQAQPHLPRSECDETVLKYLENSKKDLSGQLVQDKYGKNIVNLYPVMAYVTDTKEVIISGDEYLDVTISKIKENISTFEKQKDEKKLEKWLYIYDCMSLFFKAYPDKIKPYL